MTIKNVAIVQIAVNNEPLREHYLGPGYEKVKVPNNVGYQITIKNLCYTSILASISIDDISLGHAIHLGINKRLRFTGEHKKKDASIVEVALRYNTSMAVPVRWCYSPHPFFPPTFNYKSDTTCDVSSNSEAVVTVEGHTSQQEFRNVQVTDMYAHKASFKFKLVPADADCILDHYTLKVLHYKYCYRCGAKL